MNLWPFLWPFLAIFENWAEMGVRHATVWLRFYGAK
jgi:hypothetical protein